MRILGGISTPAIITESKTDKKASLNLSQRMRPIAHFYRLIYSHDFIINWTRPSPVYTCTLYSLSKFQHMCIHIIGTLCILNISVACLILCCQICIESRSNCQLIYIISIFVAFYRKKIWRKIIAGREIRTHDPWVRRPMRYHMRHCAH